MVGIAVGVSPCFAALAAGQGGAGEPPEPLFTAISVTQAEYDALTPDADQVYAITEAGGGSVLPVVALSQADYEALTPNAATLYVIADVPAPVTISALSSVSRASYDALTPEDDTIYRII